jgi:phosphoenolpyruvate synthase/pyruvate phosphate dikinase
MRNGSLLSGHVVSLNEIHSPSVRMVGGKAAQLAVLKQLGLNVAPAAVVLAVAHDYAQAAPDSISRQQYAQDIAALVRETLLNDENVSINPRSDLLVRSSAVSEDSKFSSYAGQFESVKCNLNDKSLADAIVAVWFSANSERAISYATARHQEKIASARMALLIQPYLRFSFSGVLFSRHPIVSLPGWMYVECLTGQLEKLVDGESLPTRLRIQKSSLRVVSEYGDPGILSPPVCAELIGGTERITQHLGYDVDIEWGATSHDELFWLQCRPLTT